MNDKSLTLEFERRWALTAGLLAVLGVALIAGSYVYGGSQIPNGDGGPGDYLMGIDGHRSVQIISSILQAIGYALLAVPMVFLFKAAAARAPQIRTGLIGVVVAAPLFMGAAAVTNAVSNLDAATQFKNDGPAKIQECVADENKKAADSTDEDTKSPEDIETDCRDDVADDMRGGTSTSGLTAGFGLAGIIGFTVAVVYTSLWAMRVGLISRFWGSLGMALGAVSILFPLFVLLWFIYIGLLIAGWIPGGRPAAWPAGEAIPWPMPGEKLAEDLEGEDDVIEGSAEPIDPHEGTSAPEPEDAPQIERRKRKKRSDQ
ncbi:MAG TPA: hypothetical protein VMF31_11710 [Solirubrobacterales bacterium]|nr:hypothetical protein [Solirubrobacterales bacterium]